MHYLSFNDAMRARFGTKVYRLSLQSGCTCPNRDGTIGTGGCTFCSEGGSGDFAAPFVSIEKQIKEARKRVDAKIPASIAPEDRRYIAYFQSYTNTYGNVDRLRALYTEAISHPQIVALDIGTRPDCLPPEMVEMLRNLQLSSGKPVWVELGLQTIHEETARRIRRGYELPVFEDAYRKLKENGLEVIVHVILGLPGESREDMLDTVRYLSSLAPTPDGIKLQLLHILKGTRRRRSSTGSLEMAPSGCLSRLSGAPTRSGFSTRSAARSGRCEGKISFFIALFFSRGCRMTVSL